MKDSTPRRDPFLRFLFVIYVATMLWLLFCRSRDYDAGLTYWQTLQRNINLQPLRTVKNYLYVLEHHRNIHLIRTAIINLGGNIFLFIPIGILLPRLWKKMRNYFLFLAVCTGAILAVETLQLFTLLGSFDIDDLILNLFGITVGFILFSITNALRNHK